MNKEEILQELEAEQAEYEAVDYVTIENQEEEIAKLKANTINYLKSSDQKNSTHP